MDRASIGDSTAPLRRTVRLSRAGMRGLSFVELAALILILCIVGFSAAPSHVNSQSLVRTEATRALGEAISAATRANYQRYATIGRTAGLAAIEQCDPAGFISLVGGTAAGNDASGGLLVLRDRSYRISTASAGSRYAGGISYCTIADTAGGSEATFAAVTCPSLGVCAP